MEIKLPEKIVEDGDVPKSDCEHEMITQETVQLGRQQLPKQASTPLKRHHVVQRMSSISSRVYGSCYCLGNLLQSWPGKLHTRQVLAIQLNKITVT